MEIRAKLEPYWFEPDGQDCRFKLRPLTPAQVAEVTDMFKEGSMNAAAFYRAGMIAIVDFANVSLNGRELKCPKDKPDLGFELVYACGVDAYVESKRIDDEDTEKN